MAKNKLFPISMSVELKEKLRVVSQKDGVSMASFVKRLLNDYFKKK